jgi:hypothetical protein
MQLRLEDGFSQVDFGMKRTVFSMSLMASAIVLSSCSGGTTYGTGSSHEVATMKGVANIFSLKSKQEKVEYQSRPDLVMPANKQALPAPVTSQDAVPNDQWPVSPEQRIASVRNAAPEPDWRTGELPVEYLNSKKEGIAISRADKASRSPVWAKEEQYLQDFQNDANGVSESKKAQELKDQISYSSGAKRKFLTEPPVEYRQPSATAEAGDLGITEEELAARKKAEIEENRANPNVVKIDGVNF